MEQKEATATMVQALTENADRLGLTWGMRPATVTDYNLPSNRAKAVYDGDDEEIAMYSVFGPVLPGFRVMALQVPPAGNFIIGWLSPVQNGVLVVRLRVNADQTIANAGTGEFVQFNYQEHNLLDGTGWSSGEPDRYIPPIPGWWRFDGRAVWTANATSRRGAFLNINGTTATPGTFGGQSLQTPATGSCQINANGSIYVNGVDDYVGLRVIQNSGAPLALNASTDGGTVLEGFYVGPFLPRAAS